MSAKIRNRNSNPMKTTTAIDWLSYTVKKALPNSPIYPPYCWAQGHAVDGNLGYTEGWELENGIRILTNYDRPEMGHHVIMSGKALSKLTAAGVDLFGLLDDVMKIGGRIRRLDLALDIHDSGANVSEFVEAFRAKSAVTAVRSFHEVKGLNEEDGHTAYFGSRTSEKMVRIYDKAAEQGLLPFSWLRVEAELKGDRAHGTAGHLVGVPEKQRTRAIHGVIQTIIDFPTVSAWADALDGLEIDLAPVGRKDTDTEKWLLDVCARAVAKHIERENKNFAEKFMKSVEAWRDNYKNSDS